MTLNVIGSGSSGNGYILDSGEEQLILECGMSFDLIEKALNFNIRHIVCALVTHNHLDHAKYVKQYTNHNIKICSTKGTLDAIGIDKAYREEARLLSLHRFGGFLVLPFKTQHDAVDPCGFLIDCPDGNRIVFATDTYYLRYTFPKVNYYMIECNYSREKLNANVKNGTIHPSVAKRITESHMSLDRCISTLKANDLTHTKAIILLHLSKDNSIEKEEIIKRVQEATGKAVFVAEKSTNITFL